MEFPEGTGESWRSFVRGTRTSPSAGERKKPPCSASAKSSTASTASRCASSSHCTLARGGVQLDQPVRDVRIVVQESEPARASVTGGAVQASVVRRQLAEQEGAEAPRGVEPVRALEPVARLRESGEREAVPRREGLVVAERLRPLVPLGEHGGAELRVEDPRTT